MATPEITIELLDLYKTYADQINISANMSSILHQLKDIKASGNEIEIALRNVLNELLPKKFKVGNGHIVDSSLTVSKQYDFVITENNEYTVLASTKDSTELFLYETVYSIGEIKATWNVKNLKSTSESIKDLRERLKREPINNKTLLSGSSKVEVEAPISQNPIRNPLFAFAFATKIDKDFAKLKDFYKLDEKVYSLPNLTIILNHGIFALVNVDALKANKLNINLYPEFVHDSDSYKWKFISIKNSAKNFAYLLFSLLEHLSSTILDKPPYRTYSSSILDISEDDLLDLDEI